MYNIFYYRIKLSKLKPEAEKRYLEKFFKYVEFDDLNFKLIEDVDKRLNKHLMKKIESFNSIYSKLK